MKPPPPHEKKLITVELRAACPNCRSGAAVLTHTRKGSGETYYVNGIPVGTWRKTHHKTCSQCRRKYLVIVCY